jgi:two-component system OmpR family response regulator
MASTTDRYPRILHRDLLRSGRSDHTVPRLDTTPMLGPRVMLIEDDQDVALVLQRYFQRSGIHTDVANTGAEAVALKSIVLPDVVLVDLELPDVDGSALIRWLREQHDCGIIVVSGSADEATRVRSLELGADDYVTKPPGFPELVARVRAVHRRVAEREIPTVTNASVTVTNGKKHPNRTTAAVGEFAVDLHAHQVRDPAGKPVNLTAAEFAVLAALIDANGEPVARDRLSEIALHRPGHAEDRGVDQLIFGLRQKLSTPDHRRRFIQSVRNAGYRLSDTHQDR